MSGNLLSRKLGFPVIGEGLARRVFINMLIRQCRTHGSQTADMNYSFKVFPMFKAFFIKGFTCRGVDLEKFLPGFCKRQPGAMKYIVRFPQTFL